VITIPANDQWAYIKFFYSIFFILLNATQGFHIFIVYIIISKKRHEILTKKITHTVKQLKYKYRLNI
jgi:hypothetical protein